MFEYDSAKSAANLAKHGIDFETAQSVWDDPDAQYVDARSDTELRFAVIGLIAGIYWTVFATPRGARVRIISARHSRKTEVHYYESQKH